MRNRVIAAVAAAPLLALGLVAAPATAQQSLPDQVDSLTVESERTSGYDRDKFGDYDRDALLASNFDAFPGCDGYFSRYDGQCYEVGGGTSKEEADDNVDVDHVVALKEAWDSGIANGDLEAFGGDTSNLTLLTSEVNQQEKGEADIAEWTPSNQLCHYVETYVATKVEYNLSVDQAEKAALDDLAANCSGGNGGGDNGGNGDGDGKDDESEEPDEAPEPDPVEGDLEVTG